MQAEDPKQKQRDQMDWNLTNHTPTPEAIQRIEAIRTTAKAMAGAIIEMTPASREQSIALTKLEEMTMFAVAAIARNETVDNQPADTPEEDKKLAEEKSKES